MPQIVAGMQAARLESIYVREGEALKPGAKLFDVSVDLSNAFAQGCPPISYFRIILREGVFVRRILFQTGALVDQGALVALFTQGADQDLSGPAERPVRIATAGVMHHAGMWSGSR